jgi:hypothetical protein
MGMADLRLPPAGPVTHRRQAYLQFFSFAKGYGRCDALSIRK